ncbi:MAG: hypothetical protein CMR00_06585 [[Chlorobium] sp. 445]|nr:MAG: hypothetical protein CMR00_06585 [[Chlorobium] sp. 445]
MRKQNSLTKQLTLIVLGAALLAGCGTMQGGSFGKPAQLRCSCGLMAGHAGAHAYNIQDFIKAKQQYELLHEQHARGN